MTVDAVETQPRIDLVAPEARRALAPEDVAALYGRPGTERGDVWLRANFVSTLDGSATGPDGRSGTLSSATDRAVFDILRRLADAVLVAAGTVRIEGYTAMRLDAEQVAWRREHGLPDHPVFVIATRSLDLDPASPIFTQAPVRPIVATIAAAPRDEAEALEDVAELVECGELEFDPHVLRAALAERGILDVLSEGGPTFLGSVVAADALDELCLTLAPRLIAGDGPRIAHGPLLELPAAFRLAHVLRSDEDDLHLRYTRTR